MRAKVYRVKLNGYLYEQLSAIAERAGKSVGEMISLFVAERCNAPVAETKRKGFVFNARKVQCTPKGVK